MITATGWGARDVLRRLPCAGPAVAASTLVLLEPANLQPSPLVWIAVATVLAVLVCTATLRWSWVVGWCAAATALGALTQLRLGADPAWLGALAAAAAVVFVGAVLATRSNRAVQALGDPYSRRVLSLSAVSAGVVLRGAALFGPDPAAGTLPGVHVEVGELTRYLIAAGVAVALCDLARCRPGSGFVADRRFRLLTWLAGAGGIGMLVLAKDLGPAVLIGVGVVAAAVHTRGVQARHAAVAVVATAALAPLLWTTSTTVRTRFHEILDPGPQLHAALIAAYSGGLIGPGPGRSTLVAGIPAIGSDYALAATVADLGAIVVVPLLILVLGSYASLVRAAAPRPDTAATLTVTFASMLGAQAGWSALGTVGILPLTGLNQPFLGVSGSSLMVSALALGCSIGLLDHAAPVTSPPPGAAIVHATATLGSRVGAVLMVVASAMLAFGNQTISDAEQLRMPRGTIWTADDHIISTDGHNERLYPDGGLYAELGYDQWNYTHRGLDAVRADTLTCGGHLGLLDWFTSLLHPVCKPADLVTTVDATVQTAAAGALAGHSGEAVVLDAQTGGVLALYATTDTAPGASPAARLRQGPPGSTMKIVTAAAGLLDHVDFGAAPATAYRSPAGQSLPNDNRETCPATDAVTALAMSCNSVYGWVAAQVGGPELQRVARTYFGADQPFQLDGIDANGLDTGLAHAPDSPDSEGATARTGIGQESVRSSVLGIALATSVIANDSPPSGGPDPTRWPHLTAAVCGGNGPEQPNPPDAVGPQLPTPIAQTIYQGMRAAATTGTARKLSQPTGSEIAAKTGTAQVGDGDVDSWITTIVNHRYVLTLVIHQPASDTAAVTAAGPILRALPTTPPELTCPVAPGATAP